MRKLKQNKEPIRLRAKKLKDGSQSLYLDYYSGGGAPVRVPETVPGPGAFGRGERQECRDAEDGERIQGAKDCGAPERRVRFQQRPSTLPDELCGLYALSFSEGEGKGDQHLPDIRQRH